ncbi:MAG: PTS sugar transporter subunit IIA [Gammaproteobacteria bacterium]|nr:PTS sugar transporter subunit IIA [Gammaproteobacteria bacterium]MBT8135153.1 PTS sugar transporter subunit IIA [Gammaproteobacteria bacterium]NNJ49963.1 PTS sugar transporter subunit IIA [Gammaproteobacteria bacterium]
MNLDTLISSNAVISNHEIKSKKRALELLAEQLASEAMRVNQPLDDDIDALDIFQLLTEREKLGSTAMGHGVALPHARTSLTEHAIGAFLKLDDGIDFDSPDNQRTDLIFALMVPEHYTDEHLKILAYLATLFNNANFCKEIRESADTKQIYHHLINWQLSSQAS